MKNGGPRFFPFEGSLASIVGHQIQQARRRAGLSQLQLARKTSLTQGYISALECGVLSPRLQVLYVLARAIGVEAAELLPPLATIFPSQRAK